MSIATSPTIGQYLERLREQVDEELNLLLPEPDTFPQTIHRAMRHSVFAGGKRLRPVLCIEAGRLFGCEDSSLRRRACALEMIHTYSLIHDDLPALDNDDLRRGKPTCHKVFGEDIAILAGDALLTLAFEVMASPGRPRDELKLQAIYELTQAIGARNGMVGGQVADLEAKDGTADAATIEYIHASKTGALIRAAVRTGALYAGAGGDDLNCVTHYGEKIGLAFQVADDLLDVLSSTGALGKTAGKDRDQHKATYPALYGIEESHRKALELAREAAEALQPYGERGQRLRELAYYLVERTS
ncbi:MAG: polyprenyl synthetase family protein [Terriglobia bacterium]